MNEIGEVERARDIYRRASGTHLPRKPNIHLAYSAFEEEHGNRIVVISVIDAVIPSLLYLLGVNLYSGVSMLSHHQLTDAISRYYFPAIG